MVTRRSPAGRAPRFLLCAALAGVLLAAVEVPRASAAEAVYLSWFDCIAPGSAWQPDQTFGCGDNTTSFELLCAFTLPYATGPDVIGVEVVVDVQHSKPTLPPWWMMAASGQCRSGALVASTDFTDNPGCADPWQGTASAEIQAYDAGEPRGQPNQIRIKAVAGVPASSARTLDASTRYNALKLVIRSVLSAPPGECSGCSDPACLVLNSILVRRIAGSPGGDIQLTLPGGANQNRATWQGGVGVDCGLVPARRSTWGEIKSLYR